MRDPAIDSLFLHLLGAAIFDRPVDVSRIETLDALFWKKIIGLARRQSVSALIADTILSLSEEMLPPREQRFQLLKLIEQTQLMNGKVLSVLRTIMEEYAEQGIPSVLLKGPGNGANYPKPLLRNPGDLDLLLYRKGDYERAREWIAGKGIDIVDADGIHYKFERDGVSIENHRRITYFDHKKYDRLFRSIEENLKREENFYLSSIGDLTVQQLPVELNAFFIFQHLFRHFVHNGVGFRQFCDWILFLSKHRQEIDADSFTALSKSFALLYPMQVFARAAEKYLDVSPSIFPFATITDDKYADKVIEDILDSGNFGFHRSGKKRPAQKLLGMWFSYTTTLRRTMKFGALSPEHCQILPFTKLMHRLKIGFR